MGMFDFFSKKPSTTAATDAPAEKQGWLSRIRDGLRKTTQFLNTDIRDLFKDKGRLVDEDFLNELRAIMIKTDMGPSAAGEIVNEINKQYATRVVEMDQLLTTVKAKLRELLTQTDTELKFNPQGTTVIMVAGVNGSGKTTSIAKLTQLFRSQGKKVLLGAADTFRAAAVEQLKIWAERLGAEIVTGAAQADPASVAHRAVDQAVTGGYDVCIVDTAGRLQTQQNHMAELGKIYRVIGKRLPDAPHEVLLVLDGTSGQNAISQARGFTSIMPCTGIVLSKIDGTAKGGVVIPIRQQFGLPVKFVGVGEKADDLLVFDPDHFVEALFEGLQA
jgi:fused signal recognition particle receptor